MRILGATLACLVICFGGAGSEIHSRPNADFYKVDEDVEEYFVEHAISTGQAKKAVQHLDENLVQPKAGCRECTRQEIRYCLGSQLINDHCCCDKRYSELFPYVPHTCYIGEKLCRPLAKDCAEYTRLRTCCCDRIVLEKWKKLLLSNGPKIYQNFHTVFLYLFILLYFLT